jgi:hypothetical protein
MLLKDSRVGALRRSTLSWCRRTRISASNAARDRNSPIKAHQIKLQRSLIGSKYQPTRRRWSAVFGLRYAQRLWRARICAPCCARAVIVDDRKRFRRALTQSNRIGSL